MIAPRAAGRAHLGADGARVASGPALAKAPSSTPLSFLGAALRVFPAVGDLASNVLGNSLNVGSDGRLTVLIAGSDFRYTRNIGERFDALMVATINPSTKQIAAVGIPRDTGNIPLPDPSDTYHGKVNSLLGHYKKIVGSRTGAIEKVRQAIAYALQVQIDYVVVNRFPGFDALVDAIGGVNVDIPLEIRDPRIIDALGPPKGARFSAGTNILLKGTSASKCFGVQPPIDWSLVVDCHHALPYVRSRHGNVGTAANNDWKRDARQQQFLAAAVARVIANGSGASLTDARDVAQSMPNDIYTTLPIGDDANLLALFNLFNGAQNQPIESVVLKPNKWAHKVPGTRRYELNLSVVRALTASWFAPVP